MDNYQKKNSFKVVLLEGRFNDFTKILKNEGSSANVFVGLLNQGYEKIIGDKDQAEKIVEAVFLDLDYDGSGLVSF